MAALADRHGVRVVADEIHAPLTAGGVESVPYLSVPGAESGLSLMSASKAWNLAGLKCAQVVLSNENAPRRAIDFHEDDEIDEQALVTLIRAAVSLNESSPR